MLKSSFKGSFRGVLYRIRYIEYFLRIVYGRVRF